MTVGSGGAGVDTGAGGRHVGASQRAAREAAEVDDHVGPLGRCEHQLAHPYRTVPHAALGADLPHRGAGPKSRLMIRALHPLRMRNRYSLGSTFRYGQTLPLTSM